MGDFTTTVYDYLLYLSERDGYVLDLVSVA